MEPESLILHSQENILVSIEINFYSFYCLINDKIYVMKFTIKYEVILNNCINNVFKEKYFCLNGSFQFYFLLTITPPIIIFLA